MTWTAAVLAGDRHGERDPVAAATGAGSKTFAPIAGLPMIAHPLRALAQTAAIDRVLVSIGSDAPALPDGPWQRVEAEASPARSALAMLDAAGPPLLVTTADHPLLTAAMIEAFIAKADDTGADVVAGMADRETVERAGSTAKRTYLRFSDAELSGCNLFALRTVRARTAVERWRSFETLRKRPLSMAWQMGPLALARYATGTLSLAAAEAAASRALGASCRLVLLDQPEAAHDVDKAADLAFAERVLAARCAAS